MRIKRLQLKNGYKRFHDLTIDLGESPKRIVALVGPNGCGKSSVLDGMLFHNAAYHHVGNLGARTSEYHSMNARNITNEDILIEFVEGNYAELRENKTSTLRQNTMFSFRSPYRYNSNLKVTQSQATSEIKLNNYGASTSSDLDDKMVENYRRLYIKYNKYLNDTDSKPSEAKIKSIGDLNKSIKEKKKRVAKPKLASYRV